MTPRSVGASQPCVGGLGLRFLAFTIGLLLLAVGCSSGEPSAVSTDEASTTVEPTPTIQPDDLVNLTVYFRAGSGPGAYLEPATREVSVMEDLPRTAVELLLAGPTDDETGLAPPLPTTTRVNDLDIRDDLATVDLSAEVISDAEDVGASPENEVLALAAIADTLTEFPAIDRVRLLVDGEAEGWRSGVDVVDFWGSWGLPPVLVRDESVIGQPSEGEGVPEFAAFAADEPQETGSADAEPVQVTSVRTRDRTTYLRVIVELTDGAEPSASAAVPVSRARPDGHGGIQLQIADVVGIEADTDAGERMDLAPHGFTSLVVGDAELPGQLEITVSATEERPFHLHSLSSPTRIVLDVMKQQQ